MLMRISIPIFVYVQSQEHLLKSLFINRVNKLGNTQNRERENIFCEKERKSVLLFLTQIENLN